MPTAAQIQGVVLCGGSGTRMGGTDKPLLDFRGEPMVAQVVRRLAAQTAGVLISANRNLERYRAYASVICDAPLEAQGPLTGVLRALQESTQPWVMIVPGDAPLLADDLVQRLVRAADQPCAVIAHDGTRAQVLHLLVHKDLEPMLSAYLDGGHRSVEGWYNVLPHKQRHTVDCADIADSFRNLNTPGDLE
jgi:molybdenum cofactor guanylyltransferase